MPPSDMEALECVLSVDKERIALEQQAEELASKDSEGIELDEQD